MHGMNLALKVRMPLHEFDKSLARVAVSQFHRDAAIRIPVEGPFDQLKVLTYINRLFEWFVSNFRGLWFKFHIVPPIILSG